MPMTQLYFIENHAPSEKSVNIVRQIAYSYRIVNNGESCRYVCMAEA